MAVKTLGVDHFGIAMGRTLHARILMAQGRHKEALELLLDIKRTLGKVAQKLGLSADEVNSDHIVCLSRMILCYELQGMPEKALETAFEAWSAIGKVGRKGNGYTHPSASRLWRKIRALEKELGLSPTALKTDDGAVPPWMRDEDLMLDEPVHEVMLA
jgi:hypothetical protein